MTMNTYSSSSKTPTNRVLTCLSSDPKQSIRGMGRVWLMVFLLVCGQLLVLSLPEEEAGRREREDCPPFPCGKFGFIHFPVFGDEKGRRKGRSECGLLEVDGCDSNNQTIQLGGEPGKWYPLSNINQGSDVTQLYIHDEDFASKLSSKSCQLFNNLTLPSSPSISFQINSTLTFLRCHPGADFPSSLEYVSTDCNNWHIYYVSPEAEPPIPLPQCELIQLPAHNSVKNHPYSSLKNQNISAFLTADFIVDVILSDQCTECYYQRHGVCELKDKHEFHCSKKGKKNLVLPLGLGLGIGNGALMLLIVLYVSERRRSASKLLSTNSSPSSVCCWNNESLDEKSIESFLRNHGPLAQRRYSYSEIKKMTRSFGDKLGQGGYGGVFKGSLIDGSLVAVKVLKEKETRTDCEEFINEVASISRTSHVNVVALLGFMVEGSKRALVYEFMPNGSLEKYIHTDPSSGNPGLGLKTLYQIALGIARGLEYLHRGCSTRILHFDIKPHNILLDDKFHPKISDFGLAKLCLQRESIVSMLGARGTPGYIAPEVFCRNFGGVSYKSDVYSYGMMVLEMVVGRKNISTEVDNSSDVYFPDWIYKRLELDEELGAHRIRNEEENQLARRMVIASLWCIQTKPPDRPSMSRVIEMLQDSSLPLTVPPKQTLSYSPPRFLEVSGSVSTVNFGS